VAGQAKTRLACLEQVVGSRAVGAVAGRAVFRHGRVLPDPGSRVILVTARAEFRGAAQLGSAIVVWRVAVRAREHPFPDRMVRGQGELGSHIRVAADAQR